MISEREAVAIFFSVLVLTAVPFAGMIGTINPSEPECSFITGTIVDKESGDDGFALYVLLDDGWDDTTEGYKVYVSNRSYQTYEMGDSYVETVCSLNTYNEIRQFIDNLTSLGLVELS